MQNFGSITALFAAVFNAKMYQASQFANRGGKPRRNGRGAAGAYRKGLMNAYTAKNLARRANGQRMVAGG